MGHYRVRVPKTLPHRTLMHAINQFHYSFCSVSQPKFLFSSGTMQYTASLLGWGVTENNGAFRFHNRISVNASLLSTTCLACIGIGTGRRLVIKSDCTFNCELTCFMSLLKSLTSRFCKQPF